MSLVDWLRETKQRFAAEGFRYALRKSIYELYVGALRRVSRFYKPGVPVWNKDWDVLVVLDACRCDAFREAYGEQYDVECTLSVGSMSIEWMRETFDSQYEDDLNRTAYVTGNPFSEDHVDTGSVAHLEEVWRYDWDEDAGIIRPGAITDAAINIWKTKEPDRMIVHYMQPHIPYIDADLESTEGWDKEKWGADHETEFDLFAKGKLGREDMWTMYVDNLRLVMDDVENRLLRSIDAEEVVITSDHGEMFGEWGLYEHPKRMPIPATRRVPWVRTTATDEMNEVPSLDRTTKQVDERLKDLGYK